MTSEPLHPALRTPQRELDRRERDLRREREKERREEMDAAVALDRLYESRLKEWERVERWVGEVVGIMEAE